MPQTSFQNLTTGKINTNRSKRREYGVKKCIVKVQIPLDFVGPCVIYNKSRSLSTYLLESHPMNKKLVDLIRAKGISGAKAYFKASWRTEESGASYLDIHADTMLGGMPW
jgi:hypothetical protein